MKTIIIPVDFSPASNNALQYVTGLLEDIQVEKVILLKNFYKSLYEQLLPTADFVMISNEAIQEERTQVKEQLDQLKITYFSKCNPSIIVETIISDYPLLRAIQNLTLKEKPDLIVVGSDSQKHVNESYIGARIIEISKTSRAPVLIVPADITYKKVEQVLLPCDFDAVSRLSSLNSISEALDLIHPELMVLNVDPLQNHINHEEENIDILKKVLNNYPHEIHYIEDQNTVVGILNFAAEYHSDLIIALPGRYSFFYNFTHNSITDALTLNAHQPILILK